MPYKNLKKCKKCDEYIDVFHGEVTGCVIVEHVDYEAADGIEAYYPIPQSSKGCVRAQCKDKEEKE